MGGPKITQLTSLTGVNVAAEDLFIVEDISAPQTKSITFAELAAALLPLMKEVTTITTDYTIDSNMEIVFASGNVTITLPAASNSYVCSIANIGTGTVTIQRAGSDTIEGNNSMLLTTQYETKNLKANGGALWVSF